MNTRSTLGTADSRPHAHAHPSRKIPPTPVALAFSLALALALPACATGSYDEDDRPYQSAGEVASDSGFDPGIEPVIGRTEWLETLNENLSDDLCEENEVFRSCYEVSESDCRARAAQVAKGCEYQLWSSIPDALNDEQGQSLGAQIGRCTGEGMFKAFNVAYAYNETESCQKLLSEM
jgi:hypothetical protein